MSRLPGRSLWERVPLRVTLVVALVLLSAVGLSVTGAVVTSQLRGYLVSQVDQDLSRLSGGDRSGQDGPGGADSGDNMLESSRDEYVAYATLAGSIATTNQQTTNGATPPDLTAAVVTAASDKGPFTVRADGRGVPWRVEVRPSTLLNRATGQVFQGLYVRGISLVDVEDTTHRLILAELAVGALVLLLLGGLAYLVVRTSLRPLQQVEVTAAEIAAGDLTRRVPVSDARTEVGRLSRAFNSMLGQIETAFRSREASEGAALASEERMRRFVADASHELRTPLTSIRGFAELYRQGAVPDVESMDRVMRRVEDEASRMGLLVEDLLLLARLDQQRPLAHEPVDLLQLAGDAVHDARVLAPDREITLDLVGVGVPVVLGDEGRLRQVITNLVSNALTHTPAGTPVKVTLADGTPSSQGHQTVLLSVADQGPGMTEADRAQVFERFYRADPSRTRAAGGSGLGLSIVAALVAAHGGRVGVQSAVGEGSRFLVELPAQQVGPPVAPFGDETEDRLAGTDWWRDDPEADRADAAAPGELVGLDSQGDSQGGHRLTDDDAQSPATAPRA